MNESLLAALTIFVLAVLVGFEVISKVPATLHTPLMSGANSIHGIVLVGAMAIAATADNPVSQVLALVAVIFAAMNVVGGYVVTDRMLQMFRRRPASAGASEAAPGGARGRLSEPAAGAAATATSGQPEGSPGATQASDATSAAPRQTG
ncbi:MAG: NAD(P) transhydrogenase subunit alpha [Chloroflexota bacterium]|nr:NAD(P) transhydrogenase subunit alpha [Chloroflexota bacterium]